VLIEAMKLALVDRDTYITDIDHMKIDPAELVSKPWGASRAAGIDPKRAAMPPPGRPALGGTIYLCTADADGMAVSLIQSNFSGFGSGVVVPGTGISLQNRGSGFSVKPDHANVVAPRKRPFHTIIPAFLTKNGQPLMSFGVMGGSMQAQGHAQVMARMVDYRQNPQAASDAPRWRVDTANKVGIEHGVSAEVIAGLRARGHDMQQADRWSTDFGRAQLIYKMDDGYCGASERRTDGQAVGY
jgi:gamma-glutamyltranspeptidase/glutathione hydrolase